MTCLKHVSFCLDQESKSVKLTKRAFCTYLETHNVEPTPPTRGGPVVNHVKPMPLGEGGGGLNTVLVRGLLFVPLLFVPMFSGLRF